MEKDFIIAGFGGQGVLLAGEVLANGFMLDNKNVTWYPSYGAEMRGGTVNCSIAMSDNEVSAVQKSTTDYALVLNQASFDRFIQIVKPNGTIIANSTLVKEIKPRSDINYVFYPITETAQNKLDNIKIANILSIGILGKVSKLISQETLERALNEVIPAHRKHLIPKNIEALKLGYEYDLLKV